MLTIRLQRVGRKNDPSFRVVVVDSKRGPQSGNFLEILGSYDARREEPRLKADRIQYWISKGAKASGTVNNLLVKAKIISGPKVHVSPNPKKKEEAEKAPENNKAADTGEKAEEKKETPAEETPKAEPEAKPESAKAEKSAESPAS